MDSVSSTKSMDFCKNVYTVPQFIGTCWFNALMMALWYSELSRKVFIEHVENLDPSTREEKKPLYDALEAILLRSYIKNKKVISRFQNELRPETILTRLHDTNPELFYLNPKISVGYFTDRFTPLLLEYMGMRKNVLFLISINGLGMRQTGIDKPNPTFRYSYHNHMLEHDTAKNDVRNSKAYEAISQTLYKVRISLYTLIYSVEFKKSHITAYVINTIFTRNPNLLKEFLKVFNLPIHHKEVVQQMLGTPIRFKPDNRIVGDDLDQNDLFNLYKYALLFLASHENPPRQAYTTPSNLVVPDAVKIVSIEDKTNDKSMPERLVFKNCSFKLDSLYFNNYNKQDLKRGHAIAGTTCKGKRYLYNGWHALTKDPSHKRRQTTVKHGVACQLFKFDWRTNTNNVCIDNSNCTFPNATTTDEASKVCFNVRKAIRVYMYVRDEYAFKDVSQYEQGAQDSITTPKSIPRHPQKVCASDQVLNPDTKRCVSKSGAIGKRIMKANKDKKVESSPTKAPAPVPKVKKDTKEFIKNLIDASGKVKVPQPKPAPVPKVRKDTKEFIKNMIDASGKVSAPSPKPKPPPPKCASDKVLNLATNRCVSKTGAIGKRIMKNDAK